MCCHFLCSFLPSLNGKQIVYVWYLGFFSNTLYTAPGYDRAINKQTDSSRPDFSFVFDLVYSYMHVYHVCTSRENCGLRGFCAGNINEFRLQNRNTLVGAGGQKFGKFSVLAD